ncbi:glutaredoxin 2 [Xanthomonadaceae bacterium JHOS43]|nr:glutaredoxin 2 [Xanthomonadaceae bacterium JHOS43]
MKLYIYEHCPFCTRVLMLRGLKQLDIPVQVIPENDVETPTRLVGRKVVPILQKDDGSFMPESMDIVRHLDATFPPPVLVATLDPAIDAWCKRASDTIYRLCVPRFTRGNFAELATPDAREAYVARETRAFGDLDSLTARTPALLDELAPLLTELEGLVRSPGSSVGESDFQLYPLLRSLSIVNGLRFGPKVTAYYDAVGAACGLEDFSAQAM